MKCQRAMIACLSWLMVSGACQAPELQDESGSGDAMTEKASAPPVAPVPNAAVGKPVTASCPPNAQYSANGLASLVDGRTGSDDYLDEAWMGWWYEDKPFEATIDLGKVTPIEELGVNALATSEAWIFYPKKVEFELSMDGKTFAKVATIKPTKEDFATEEIEIKKLSAAKLGKMARFVRVRVERFGALPDWHPGHGGADGYEGEAWLFIDEIFVNPK